MVSWVQSIQHLSRVREAKPGYREPGPWVGTRPCISSVVCDLEEFASLTLSFFFASGSQGPCEGEPC